ncbi:MAG: ribosomal L7Ae/L30e/S12e/Gadd45 family protein [Candidatus Woesearchaeota archaeon]|nr:ribosomal L7Ae/L30e/S12e/Gadd45 family protein [Candidatus Woesearchaeota archaeon]
MKMDDIKKLVKEKKVYIGTRQTLKGLKTGKVSKVFLASNCPISTRETVMRYAKMSNVPVEVLKIPNDELGIICMKRYFISVMSVKK